MNLSEYIQFFKDFAKTDPDLLHDDGASEAVFCLEYSEAVTLLRNITNRMVLLIPPYGKHVRHNNAMGNVWIKEGVIFAVGYAPIDDLQARIEIQGKAEQILDRLYRYMFHKRNSGNLYGFDPTDWESDSIGPVGENHYGYFAEFAIKDGVEL